MPSEERDEDLVRRAVAQWPPPPPGPIEQLSSQPLAPQPLGTSFTGATLSESGFVPPDSMGAVGPTQYVVLVNGRAHSKSDERRCELALNRSRGRTCRRHSSKILDLFRACPHSVSQ